MESGIDEDWQMVDYYPPFKQEKSQVRWLMDIGKKVVIGGLVLSSLPFVLPPLVVISTLGLALSLPCGVVLASYACTQKLMTKLLPSPAPAPPPPPSPPTHLDGLEAGIVGFEDVKEMGHEFDDVDMDNNDDVVNDAEEVGGGVNEEEDEQGEKKPYFNGEDLLTEKKEEIITETMEEEKGEVKENGTDEGEKRENLPQGNNGEVETIITEKNEGDKDEKIITETKSGEGERENLEKEKIMTEQAEKPNKESGKRRKKKKSGGKRREEAENVESDVVIAVEGLANIDEDVPVVEEEKIEVTIKDDSGAAVEIYKSTTIVVDAAKATAEKDIAPALHSEDQEAFGDDKIWEKIDAIRDISGFKAPRRDSYYDELKALYLFTGIEAPSTSSDTPADFVEFYSKLCFLMSVIGVK